MATVPVVPAPGATPAAETPKPFDPLAHITARNAADQASRSGKAFEPAKPATDPATAKATSPAIADVEDDNKATLETHTPKLPRSVRRELNKLREDKARAEGRLSVLEELGIKPKEKEPAPVVADDPEPQHDAFATDAEYNRALGRWDARQETKKELAKHDETGRTEQELAELKTTLKAMDEKAAADAKLIPDWDEVAEKAGDLEVNWPDHPNLYMRLGLSDVKALMLYHWAKNPTVLEGLVKLSSDVVAQDRAFSRLEGQIEKLYTSQEPKKETPAAPAGGEPAKPAEKPETKVATPAERDAGKPRPSSEVAAPRGGAPAPEEPAPGTAAWMARKNQIQFGR